MLIGCYICTYWYNVMCIEVYATFSKMCHMKNIISGRNLSIVYCVRSGQSPGHLMEIKPLSNEAGLYTVNRSRRYEGTTKDCPHMSSYLYPRD
jgi:hypothetical protein